MPLVRNGFTLAAIAVIVGLMPPSWQALAQSSAAETENKEVLATGGLISSLIAAPVVGQPYSAVQVTQTSRKLADGTTISHKGHHSVARDSEGRVRVERRLAKGSNGEPDTVMVFVMDPVAHKITMWSTGAKVKEKTAVVVKIPATRKQEAVKPQAQPTGPQPVITVEDLGAQSIQGLPVMVEKKTTIVPVGRSGNDAPITKTVETWTSPDLKLVMKRQWEDPRTGETTVALENFSRAEPDAALFRAPAGYATKDLQESLKELEEKLAETQNER